MVSSSKNNGIVYLRDYQDKGIVDGNGDTVVVVEVAAMTHDDRYTGVDGDSDGDEATCIVLVMSMTSSVDTCVDHPSTAWWLSSLAYGGDHNDDDDTIDSICKGIGTTRTK